MDLLKKTRKPLRGMFTRTLNEVKGLLEGDGEVDKEQVIVKMDKLRSVQQRLCDLDSRILDHLVEVEGEGSEDRYAAEVEACEGFADELREISRKVEKTLRPDEQVPKAPSTVYEEAEGSPTASRKTMKLPKIELRKFNGNLKDWLGWWSQFRKIDDDKDLHSSDKFEYLLQCMEKGSRPRELVESYPQCAENYPKAVSALKDHFGREDLLVEVYVRELLKLQISNVSGRDRLPLSSMFVKLEAQLRALETMGVTNDKCAAILYPLVESSLPEDVLRAWQRSPLSKGVVKDDPKSSRLSQLMEFLRDEVDGEQRIALAKTGFGSSQKERKERVQKSVVEEDIPTAAALFTGDAAKCLFCDRQHDSKDCIKAQTMSLKDKKERVQRSKCCFVCLRKGHQSKVCKASVKCILCHQKHQTIMCPELKVERQKKEDAYEKESVNTATSVQMCTRAVLLQTLVVELVTGGRSKKVRALIDQGSQRSYILSKTATELGMKPVGESSLVHTLFGGVQTQEQKHHRYSFVLRNPRVGYKYSMEALESAKICGRLPQIKKGPWMRSLKTWKIWIDDVGDGEESPEIELLIGADFYGHLITGGVHQLDSGLTAVQTKLGWTLMGKCGDSEDKRSVAMTVTSLLVSEAAVADLWKLEAIGIQDPIEVKTQQMKDQAAREHFLKNVSRASDGRYMVALPWTEGRHDIPSNLNIAEKRLGNATRKLVSAGKYEDYNKIFMDWEDEGIIEKVPECEVNMSSHYLPHHAVFKPESLTTKIRPVFDASCKANRNPSLNDLLERGPNLLEKIPSILLRFREKQIGVISDIRKAFLMIDIKPEDRNFVRFLWWEDSSRKKLVHYRHRRVVFGVTSSPFLLGAVIEYHLEQYKDKEASVVSKLLKSLYVDNCVTSCDTMEEVKDFQQKSTAMLAEAKLELRMWEWTSGESAGIGSLGSRECGLAGAREGSTSGVLGYVWNKQEDTMQIDKVEITLPEVVTKKKILSIAHQVYDPIGFTSPALLSVKFLLREACVLKLGWDEELPEDISKQFRKWTVELPDLQKIKLSRRLAYEKRFTWSVHVFSDASQVAYGAVVFLRSGFEGDISVSLLQAKSRVAPMKEATIPRLELMGCCIASRLAAGVKDDLELHDVPIHYYTDSSTALAWIKRNSEWGTFVGNRVKEIGKLSCPDDWRHVPGVSNPADLPSRGCSPSEMLKTEWWRGPSWLYYPEEDWPKTEDRPDESAIALERKRKIVSSLVTTEEASKWYERLSSYKKIVRVCGWVRRFVHNYLKVGEKRTGSLTEEELRLAECCVIRLVQRESFPAKDEVVRGLRVQRDDDGLIRVKTKLLMGSEDRNFRLPLLLPTKHHVVSALIREVHLKNSHGGIQFLMAHLRENYWILQSRRAIRTIVSKCVRCRRFEAKSPTTVAAPLPKDRIRDAAVFEVVGVDLAGPLFLKDRSKVWIVLYTCAVYRAVHLELVTSLSTECFIQSLRRFIARRGRPSIIYSDNGTNFVGTSNALRDLDWKKISENVERITWKFNPPSAAWWGGWWERLVRSIKGLLVRVLGKATLGYEELLTVLCDSEAVINGRPLTYVSENDDLIPLTPAAFLHEIRDVGTADLDVVENCGFERRFRYRQKVRDELRGRFRKEYLGQLVQRGSEGKGMKSFKVGDVVLVGSDNRKKLDWPLARVIELIPGRDKVIRVARIKTRHGELVRPVQRLYGLEVGDDEARDLEKLVPEKEELVPGVRTRAGRLVKTPQRYSQ